MSPGRWRELAANLQHAGGVGGWGILLAGQLVTSVGGPGLTRRRPAWNPPRGSVEGGDLATTPTCAQEPPSSTTGSIR